MTVITRQAWARVNWGRWIADCPELYCNNAETLEQGQATFHCSVCQIVAPVTWPDDPRHIMWALLDRPRLANRNWYPAGYDEAVRLGIPHGQSPADLIQETRDHEGEG